MTTLSRNVVINIVGQALVLVLSFVAVRFIFRLLGGDVFGIIYFNVTLAALLTTVLELGISATTVREVSQHFDTERPYIERLIQTFSLIYWTFGIVIVVAVFFGAPLLVEHWINLTSIDPGTAANMIRILSIGTMVALPRALYTSLFRGRQRMAINNTIDVAIAAAQQAGVVIILNLGGGVYLISAWMSAAMLVGIVVYLVLAGRMFGARSLVPRFDPAVITRNLRFTALMMSNSLLALVHSSVDKVVVSKLLPIEQFGFYGFASTTVGRATFVSQAISQAAFPSFANLFKTDRAAMKIQYRKVQDLVSYSMVPVFAGIVFASIPLYTYIFNSAVAETLLLPTALLCLGFAMNAVSLPAYTMSVAAGRPGLFAQSNTAALFVTVPVAVIATVIYGINGAAFSWVFFNAFSYAYAIPLVSRRCLDQSPWSWYFEVGKPFALAGVVYGAAWALLTATGSRHALWALALALVGASVLYAGGAFLLIGEELRYTMSDLAGKARSRLHSFGAARDADVPARAGSWRWDRTVIVGATAVILGAALGALDYFQPPAAAAWMAVCVVIAGGVLVATLGATVGAMVLLIVTCFIDKWVFAVHGLNLRPEQVALVLAGGVFLMRIAGRERPLMWRPNLAEAALAAWLAIGLLSSLFDAPDRGQSLKVLLLIALSAVPFFLARRLLAEGEQQVDEIVGWLLLGFAAEAAVATIAYFLHLFGPTVLIGLNPANGHLDAFGTLWEPNVLGGVSAAGAIAWIYLGPRYFESAWIGVALCLTACVASFARAAWLAGLIVMFLTLILPVRQRLDMRAFGFGAMVATLLTVFIAAADHIGHYSVSGTISNSIGNATDIIGRLRQIGPVLNDLQGRLLIIGGGTNSFAERHVFKGVPQHLANLELTVLNDTGVIGVILFAVFGIAIAIAAWRARRDLRVAGLGAMLLVIALDNTSTETTELMITWLLAGILLAAIDRSPARQPARDASQSSRYRLVTSSQL